MIKTLGWVLTVWGVYAGLSAYMAGNMVTAIIAFIMSGLIMFTNIGSRTSKVYSAILCIRDDSDNIGIHHFMIGVANSLPTAGALVKLEAKARQTKEKQDADFTTADDFYIVQEREMNSASILQEFNFTSNGDFILE